MTRRNKMLLYIGLGVFLLLLLLLILFLLNRQTISPVDLTNQQPTTEPRRLPVIPSPNTESVDVVSGQPEVQASLRAIAQTFAERYGSYSNQQAFNYIDDIAPFMTVKMQASARDYLKTMLAPHADSSVYYGITTTVLSVYITEYDEVTGRAHATVSTQRQESVGSTVNPRVDYEVLEVDLVKTGSGWHVDSAYWL